MDSAFINKEEPENRRSIFLRTLLPSIFLALEYCSVVLLLRLMGEGEGEERDDEDDGRFVSSLWSL